MDAQPQPAADSTALIAWITAVQAGVQLLPAASGASIPISRAVETVCLTIPT